LNGDYSTNSNKNFPADFESMLSLQNYGYFRFSLGADFHDEFPESNR
jgi:hypothetical protein